MTDQTGIALDSLVTAILREVSDLAPWAYSYKERPDDLLEVRASELESIVREQLAELAPTDRTTPIDPLTELLRVGAVNRELRAENERLLVDLTHRVGWEERCLRAEAEIQTWGQIWNDEALLAGRVEALRDGTADLGNERFDKRYRDAEDEVERLQRSCDRLRASMETAAALARHSDSDLANAMLQALDRSS